MASDFWRALVLMLVYLWNPGIHVEWEVTQLGLASFRTQSRLFPRLPKISLHVSHSKAFMLRGWMADSGRSASCDLFTLSKKTVWSLLLQQAWWWSLNTGGFLLPVSKFPSVLHIMLIIYWEFFKVAISNKLTLFSVEIAQTRRFCWFYHPLNVFWESLDSFVDLSILVFVHKAVSLPIVLWGNCWDKTIVSLMARLILLVGLSMKLRFAESHVTFQALFMIWL